LGLDPRPQTGSPATLSPRVAPANGFYADARYYGAFTSSGNWAVDWTAIGNSGIMNPAGSCNPVVMRMDPVTTTIIIQGLTVTFTGKLQEADSLDETFKDVPAATSPYIIPAGSPIKFYRASN
ncbi:MAG: hypothetical protein ACKPGI_12260, partial [Verrucomicrobiota bacterium]